MTGELPDWRTIEAELARRQQALSAEELDELAESLFWLDRRTESIAIRGRAYLAHVGAGADSRAAMVAWHLFYEHALVGEMALANGWFERARRHAVPLEGSAAWGFVAVAEADRASAGGALDDALDHVGRAVEVGVTTGDADLTAMALQVKGRVLVAAGRHAEGVAALDEAMVAVVNGELSPLFTGWVYCNALSTCHDLADLGRAVEWSDAATKWCEELPDGRLYSGICRLHVVELASLRGAWSMATDEAQRACRELTAHDPRYAGEAHYLIGELRRLTGDLDLAEEAFTRAHDLGRVPQPGLGRVRLAQGRIAAAVNALQLALEPAPAGPMRRAELLSTLAEAKIAADDTDGAQAAAFDLSAVARGVASDYIRATSLVTSAAVSLATADPTAAFRDAGRATARFRSLGLPYDEARALIVRGRAAEEIGEPDTAVFDLTAARAIFARLGAGPDAQRTARLLGGEADSPLSERETEVLRLVARGGTNKEVAAELVLSEHTVARHLSNIYSKLGVGSRSAAVACAYEQSLI